MIRVVFALLVAATTATAAPAPEPSPALPAAIATALGRMTLAEPRDFIGTMRAYDAAHPDEEVTRGQIVTDLNGDGRPDYALVGVNRATLEFRVIIAVSRPDGGYDFARNQLYRGAFPQRGGPVYVAIALKPAGDERWADKLYSRLTPGSPERAAYRAVPAIAVWRSVGLDPYSRPDDYEVSSLAYCRDIYYYPGGQARTFMVCQ